MRQKIPRIEDHVMVQHYVNCGVNTVEYNYEGRDKFSKLLNDRDVSSLC
jgi:hypothetical protein